MEHPSGIRKADIIEYSTKYLKELDRFFSEVKENGLWILPLSPITEAENGWSIMMIGQESSQGVQGYMPMWSNPADALSLSMHIEGPQIQSIPFDMFVQVIKDNPKPGIVAGLNPIMVNSKKENGEVTVGTLPLILIPFPLLFEAYKGEQSSNFSTELAPWILASKSAFDNF